MLDLYVTIHEKTPEVMILDCNVLRTRLHLLSNHKCDRPLIIFVDCDWFFEKTVQHLWCVSLNLKYELNLLHKNEKS